MKNEKFAAWLPTIIFGGFTLVFIIYFAAIDGNPKTVYLQLALCFFAPAIFPLLGIITKKPYPVCLSVLCGVLAALGIYGGKVLNFYNLIPHYDKILHTNFGLVGAAMIYALLMRWGGEKLHPSGLAVIIIMSVLGLGVIWEFIEFAGSIITTEDPQRVWDVVNKIIASGNPRFENPVNDTMQDLLVTAIGSSVFMIFYFIDNMFGGKVCKKMFVCRGAKTKVKIIKNS